MKRTICLMIFAVIVIVVSIFININDAVTPEISVEYINEEVLDGMNYVDQILSVSYGNDYIVCFCAVSKEEFMFLVLNRDEEYSLNFRENFSVDALSNDPLQIKTDKMHFTDEDIYYNVFLNPKVDTVLIEGNSRKVHIVEYEEYRFGFWWLETQNTDDGSLC